MLETSSRTYSHSGANFIFGVNPDSAANCDCQIESDSESNSRVDYRTNSEADSGTNTEADPEAIFGTNSGADSRIDSGIGLLHYYPESIPSNEIDSDENNISNLK